MASTVRAARLLGETEVGPGSRSLPEEFRRDLRAKIRLAAEAWPAIRNLSFQERVALCLRVGQGLAEVQSDLEELLVEEAGNPRKFARWEAARATETALDFPQVLEEIKPRDLPARRGRNVLYHEPYGVVGVMSPGNAPLVVPLYNLLSALGAGNAVVLRPSAHAPTVAHRLVDLFYRAGAPAHTIQISTCRAEEATWEFIENPLVRVLVTYAGSAVGKDNLVKLGRYLEGTTRRVKGCLQIDGRLLHYVPELAGNDPLIVLDGADLEAAAGAAVVGAFANAGQLCFSAKRILVEDRVAGEFRTRFASRVSSLRVGDAADPEVDVVPIRDPRTVRRSVYQFEEALRKGGTLLTGGFTEDERILPTLIEFDARALLDRAPEEKPFLWVEEAFAPIRSLVVFRGDEQCLALANDSVYGLGASIFGPVDRALALARRLESARVAVNESPLFGDPHLPIGGIKDSGLRGSPHKVHELTYVKRIHVGQG
ncbi:MAG TPA: aldehyde dehydrogenase family protein [Actinomycetota bacterium]|nr:aldehyde dehydrogenase family protein [Actinomycetota bacterium]